MSRGPGVKLPAELRRQAVEMLQGLVAAGISDVGAARQVAGKYNVTRRTARTWLNVAYRDMAGEAEQDRAKLLGVALRRRRVAMSRAAKKGDWKTYLAASDSEARLMGLDAPKQTEHHVMVEKVQDMSRAVVDVVRDYFQDDAEGRARFVGMLQERVNLAIAQKVERRPLVIEAEVVEAE